jgi:hypothetical protein
MERIVFLLSDGSRIGCMLNPSTILVRRYAGIAHRTSGLDSITGWDLTEDPLQFTGGGKTEFILELLFDLMIAGSTEQSEDIRDLTGPLWRLSESSRSAAGNASLSIVRLIWGKAWNIPGVVAEVAELLGEFSPSGAPTRSLLTMRFVRVNEMDDRPNPAPPLSPSELAAVQDIGPETAGLSSLPGGTIEVVARASTYGTRPDLIAARAYRSESMWRLVLAPNGIADPFQDLANESLTLLPRSVLGGRGESA